MTLIPDDNNMETWWVLEKMDPNKPEDKVRLQQAFKETKNWRSLKIAADKLEINADEQIRELQDKEVQEIAKKTKKIWKFIKAVEAAHKATKNSKLNFRSIVKTTKKAVV
jgi:nitroimidazol reductase NimA-like FMN-containing flavoprotein (pyridoxamine 5'-phosphate oxidase superfamily)